MFALKQYQERALDKLGEYLRAARDQGARTAFIAATDELYHPVPGLPEMPCVCLRVPTGGGKTVMACHAVGLATRELVEAEHSVVLWLVPTNQILQQTLAALRDPRHPYRDALENGLGTSAVSVLNLSDALHVPRSVLDGETCVIVSTLAALRVEDTEGRKVYETSGHLMSHFQGLSPQQQALLESDDGGRAYSLANVLRLRRPVVIMDEAHNARTPLSFATLERFRPACVIEFTATPQRTHDPERGLFASNVLCNVSAWELKAESMIKMPLHLETLPDWRNVVAEALRQREVLEERARDEAALTGEYLRPIVLIQAEPRSQSRETLTVDVIERAVIDDFHIPADQVRVATGERREIADDDLLSPDCPVRVIITIQALREGWDCSFAYVLCSVAEIGAPTAVEQILGRIMRLPYAREKQNKELNAAYAYVASQRFQQTASALCEGLISNGFHRLEAQRTVQAAQGQLFAPGTLFPPDLTGRVSPADTGTLFEVPRFTVNVGGQRELWEPEDYLPADWSLADCDATLGPNEFTPRRIGGAGDIAVTENGLKVAYLEQVQAEQLALLEYERAFTKERLVNWLDRNIPHPDVAQEHSLVFLSRMVDLLLDERNMTLETLTRERFRLRDAAIRRIADHRQEARRGTFQAQLLDAEAVEVTPNLCFRYDPWNYPASRYYDGTHQFQKHYYGTVGQLKPEGEEWECAVALDSLPEVKHWVRNIERNPRHSFWLPTPSDKFYPDFVAQLNDGRYLVVEYKGKHLLSNDDTKEKDALGRLWADRSEGRCLFFMATQDNLHKLAEIVG